MTMSEELKTLKDINHEPSNTDCVVDLCCKSPRDIEIKTEAINWIKALEDRHNWKINGGGANFKLVPEADIGEVDYEQDDGAAIIKFIKYFFDITEEDLK